MLGHEELNYRKKAKTRQEWRPVQRGEGQQEAAIQLNTKTPQNNDKERNRKITSPLKGVCRAHVHTCKYQFTHQCRTLSKY